MNLARPESTPRIQTAFWRNRKNTKTQKRKKNNKRREFLGRFWSGFWRGQMTLEREKDHTRRRIFLGLFFYDVGTR